MELDIGHRLHFLTLKCKIFALSGQPTKCFSIAIRAASSALRHQLYPTAMEALAALAAILNELGEFNAARDILESSIPMVRSLPHPQHRLLYDLTTF